MREANQIKVEKSNLSTKSNILRVINRFFYFDASTLKRDTSFNNNIQYPMGHFIGATEMCSTRKWLAKPYQSSVSARIAHLFANDQINTAHRRGNSVTFDYRLPKTSAATEPPTNSHENYASSVGSAVLFSHHSHEVISYLAALLVKWHSILRMNIKTINYNLKSYIFEHGVENHYHIKTCCSYLIANCIKNIANMVQPVTWSQYAHIWYNAALPALMPDDDPTEEVVDQPNLLKWTPCLHSYRIIENGLGLNSRMTIIPLEFVENVIENKATAVLNGSMTANKLIPNNGSLAEYSIFKTIKQEFQLACK